MTVFTNLVLNPGSKSFNLNNLQNLGTFNPDFNVPLTGDVTLLPNSETFQYLDPNGTNRVLDFPSVVTALIGKIHIIVHTGTSNRFDVFVDGVDTGFNIRRNQVWLVHFTNDWNFFRLV